MQLNKRKVEDYNEYGFSHHQSYFKEEELLLIEPILIKFHNSWLKENRDSYSKGALNSHSITSSKDLDKQEKKTLFNFISKNKINDLLSFEQPKFLNTQLFFDPIHSNQKNYWHRDIQYNEMSDEQQKQAIKTQNVVHFRIPLKAEQGIELIPGTHRRWDSKEEFDVRKSLNYKKPSDDLETGKLLKLKRTDLLIFSANMIHRGIYGNDRFSFDIIYCDNNPEILKYRDKNNLPDINEWTEFSNSDIFKN